jgi:hypothetical protein
MEGGTDIATMDSGAGHEWAIAGTGGSIVLIGETDDDIRGGSVLSTRGPREVRKCATNSVALFAIWNDCQGIRFYAKLQSNDT